MHRPPHPRSLHSSGQAPTYMQMMMSLQTSRPEMPESSSYTKPPVRRSSSLRKPPSVYLAGEEEGEGEEPGSPASSSVHGTNFLVPDDHLEMRRMSRHGRRPVSADSASVYSAASAPTDPHERAYQPMALGPAPVSAPAWGAPSMRAQQGRQMSTIREALAPETYATRARAQPLWRVPPPSQLLWRQPRPARNPFALDADASAADTDADAVPPVPPLPEDERSPRIARPRPAALRVVPDFSPAPMRPGVQEWAEVSIDAPARPPGLALDPPSIEVTSPEGVKGKRRADSVASSSSSTQSAPGPPPGLPPRSPLRPPFP